MKELMTDAPVKQEKAAFGCMIAFSVPFCAVSLIGLYKAIASASAGRWDEVGKSAVFFVAFGAAGFGLLGAMLWGRRELARQKILQQELPDQPWRWEPRWVDGRIRDTTMRQAYLIWIVAVGFSAAVIPIFVQVFPAWQRGQDKAWVGFLFPLAALALIVAASYMTIRSRKYGRSTLEIVGGTGIVGHSLAGRIFASDRVAEACYNGAGIELRLTCRRTTKTRDRESQSVLWRDAHAIAQLPRGTEAGPGRCVIPVYFELPTALEPTTPPGQTIASPISWSLEAAAVVPGIDYLARFDVPVFVTEPTHDVTAFASAAQQYRMPTVPPHLAEHPGIVVKVDKPRHKVIRFGAARAPGMAGSLTLFGLIVLGAAFFWHAAEAPKLVWGGCGILASLLLLGAVQLWLKVRTLEIKDDALVSRWHVLGVGRTRRARAAAVLEIRSKENMSHGERAYHLVEVRTNDRRITVASALGRRDAEWLKAILEDWASGASAH